MSYAMSLARSTVGQSGGFEGTLINQFVFFGDRYRDAVTHNVGVMSTQPYGMFVPVADPRYDRGKVYGLAVGLEDSDYLGNFVTYYPVYSSQEPINA